MVGALKQSHKKTGIIEFARMTPLYQVRLLALKGELLDVDFENDRFIHLYHIDGFFAEVIISPESGILPQVIPFRNGYRLSSYRRIALVNPGAAKPEHPFSSCGYVLLPNLN